MSNPESQEYYDNLTAQALVGLETPVNAALRERRKELGLEQQQLAERVGFKTGGAISHFETLRYFPNPKVASNIAGVLDVPTEELFPEWLKLFIEDRKKSTLARVEITESEVDPRILKRAYEKTEKSGFNFTDKDSWEEDPYVEVEYSELTEEIRIVLGSLTLRERRVLELRFGLKNEKGRTLEEVAREFDVIPERIRQIEAKSLRKLRHPSRRKRLKDFLDEKPGDPRSPQALINGAVNAMYQGDLGRTVNNLDAVLAKYLSDGRIPTGVIDQLKALLEEPDFYKWSDRQINTFMGCLEIPSYLEDKCSELEARIFEEVIPNLCLVEKLRSKLPKPQSEVNP